MADLQSAQAARMSLSYAAQLLQHGRISDQEHDELVSLISQDVNNASNLTTATQSFTVTIPGATVISTTVNRRTFEAASRVFNTPELLEAVLVHSDLADLLLSINFTCKGIRDLIETSLPIQRKLFLRPDPTASPCVTARAAEEIYWIDFAQALHARHSERYDGCEGFGLVLTPLPDYLREDFCSLREMYLTQPPIKHLVRLDHETFEPVKTGEDGSPETEWHDERGFTFGRLADIFEQNSFKDRRHDFAVGEHVVADGILLLCCAGPNITCSDGG